MAKQFIRRIMPDHKKIRTHKHLQLFGSLLHDNRLWHLNRRSASGAFAVGLFFAFLPFPMQMVFAAAAAIAFRVNLPLSVALVWVTNPLTIPPAFYFAYLVGTWVLGSPPAEAAAINYHAALSMESLSHVWEPLLVGSLICGAVCGALGYLTIRGLWRLHIVSHLKQRKLARQMRKKLTPTPHP